MIRAFFIILVGFSTIFAKTYKDIEFKGLVHLSEFSAFEILEFDSEDNVDEEMIDGSIKRFFAQGYFVDIKVEDIDGSLIYTFKEKPLISNITVNGVKDGDIDEKYLPIMGVKKGDIYDEKRLKRAKDSIIELTRAEGFYATVVEYTVKKLEDSVEVVFDISKGKKIVIHEAIFDGAKDFDADELDDTLANKEVENFSWFFGQNTGELSLLNLEYDDARLKDFYLTEGYLDAEVSDPFLKADLNNFTAKLYYKIFEGKPYTVVGTDIEIMDKKEINLEDLKEDLKQKQGKTFNIKKVRQDLEAIKEEVGSYGYAFARVFPDIDKDKETQTAKVTYKVLAGEKVYIRDVIISGNSRTLDRVVRREVFQGPGELYNLRDIKESKRALGRLGFFESIELNEKRVDSKTMDLIVEVKETATGSLQAGGGWNSVSGFMYSMSVSDRNIFGSSIGFSLSGEKSDDTSKFSLSLTNPRLNDGEYSLSTSLFTSDYKTDDYETNTNGVSVTLGRELSRHWRASIGTSYSLDDNRYFDLNDTQRDYYIEGELSKISLTPYISFDNTDDFFVPRSGQRFSSSIEVASFGGDQQFTKNITSFSTFYGLQDSIDFDIVLRYKARLSLLDGNLDNLREVPLGSRLYMGGLGSVRGFNRNSLSPVDKDTYNTTLNEDDIIRTGGNRGFSNSLEASFPLIPSAKMRFSTFYDAGWIGKDKFDIARSSYGTAIEWYSPMGPIMFIWAWPLDEEPLDRTGIFEFTIGQKF